MKQMWKRLLSLVLVIALAGMLLPDTILAADSSVSAEADADASEESESDLSEEEGDGTQETAEEETVVCESSVTVDEDGEIVEEESADEDGEVIEKEAAAEETIADEAADAAAEAASDTETAYEYQTTYSLSLTVSTAAASSTSAALKKVTVSTPQLTTTVTRVSAAGSEVVSQTTTAYSLTLRVHVRNSGWKTASLNSEGTAYTYTASEASSGNYIQALQIKPSAALSAALNTAGLTYVYRADTKYWDDLGWAAPGQSVGSIGNSNPMTGLELKVVNQSDVSGYDQTNRFISTTSVTYRTRYTGSSSWNAVKKNGSTSGKKNASSSIGSLKVNIASGDSSLAFSGSIRYSVRTTISDSSSDWSSYRSDGTAAGSKNKKIQAIRIKLTGELSEKFDVYYRVYVGQYGWLGWAKNGEKAGTKGIGLAIGAIQIKLVPKGKSISGSTSKHYIKTISGDTTLDGYLTAIYKKKGTNLRTLYNYVASYTYIRYYVYPKTSTWKTWSIEYAKDMYEKQGGNCYRYASLFCWLARGLGYDARVMTGYVPSRSRGWAPHGWVEMKQNGTTYIYDPDLYHDHPTRNWYKRTYSNAPTTYRRSYA